MLELFVSSLFIFSAEGCQKGAKGTTGKCIAHGGGKR